MFPRLFSIGEFFLPTYGVLICAAFLTALWLTSRLARRSGLNPDLAVNLGIYCALAGIAGAKLAMFLFDFDYYSAHPLEIFSLSTLRAGGVFQGGLVGAVAVAFWYVRKHRLPGLRTADAFAPGLALGHAIGRVGCFAAGCCWGVKCNRPWAVTFTDTWAHRLSGTELGVPLHPTQLYEAFAEAAIFAVLYWRFRRAHRDGQVIGLYLALYSVARFAIEFFRSHDQALTAGLSLAQWIALPLLLAGLWLQGGRGFRLLRRS